MAFSRVGTGRGPLECTRDRPPTRTQLPEQGSNDGHSVASRCRGARPDGPATTVYTQAIGAANALRRKQRKALNTLGSNATEKDLERVIARNARQVGLGLRSGMWLPTNAIAKTSSSIDNQPGEGRKLRERRRKRRPPSMSPTPPPMLDPIAAQIAADGAARAIEAHLAANTACERAYSHERRHDEEQLERLMSGGEDDQTIGAANLARLQSLPAEAPGAESKQAQSTQQVTQGTAADDDQGTAADDDQPMAVSYRQQSSKRLNTDVAHVARQQLRVDPLVCVAIDRIWLLVTGYGRSTHLDRETFLNFNILVQKALDLESSFDVFEAERSAAAEWEADTASLSAARPNEIHEEECSEGISKTQHMSHHQFHDSLFELVDIWTCEISSQSYAAFLWQLLQRISCVCVVFDDSALDNFRTRKLFSHDKQGAAAWDTVRRDHQGQDFAARYSLKSLNDVLPWTEHPTTKIYTHPQLFKEVENQTQLLRAELIEDNTYLHGAAVVDTSKEIMRNSSHSFSGLVSGTAVGWPFDGNTKSKNGLSTTRQETFEVITGRRVINRFRDKRKKDHATRRRTGLSHRRIGSLCTCQRCRAACEVQRFRRGLLGRRLALMLRTERDAARTIQNASRRWLDSRQAAAIQIQRTWRGYSARAYLHRGDSRPAAIATSPVDDEIARQVCEEEETLKPEHEPELALDPEQQAEFDLPLTRPLPGNFSRFTPHYSYIDESGRPNRVNADCTGDQLFLNGVSMAVQCAATPLLTELSAEALHWERERARQLKAHVAPVKMLQLAGGIRADSYRIPSEPGSASVAVDGHQWMPTRTSLQRPTSDPQLLSKLLLRSRSSRSTSTAAGVGRLQARVFSRRPVSAPSSKSTSQCMWSSHSSIEVQSESRKIIQTR